MNHRLSFFVSACIISLTILSQSIAKDTEHSYTFSSDPEEIILSMSVSGGLANIRTRYDLFGDGRLQKRVGPAERRRLTQVQLTHLETDDLIRIAVEGGLIGLSWEALQERIREETGHAPSYLTDSTHLHIEIHLESFANSKSESTGPFTSIFSCDCIPAYLNRYTPQLNEVASLHKLTKQLQNIAESGKEHQ